MLLLSRKAELELYTAKAATLTRENMLASKKHVTVGKLVRRMAKAGKPENKTIQPPLLTQTEAKYEVPIQVC